MALSSQSSVVEAREVIDESTVCMALVGLVLVTSSVACSNETGPTSSDPAVTGAPASPEKAIDSAKPAEPSSSRESAARDSHEWRAQLVGALQVAPAGECWAADIQLDGDACATSHQHIATALHSCWARGGEPVEFAAKDACETNGFRSAKVQCCTAPPFTMAPPAFLPEPEPTNSESGGCAGGSSTSSGREQCGAPVGMAIVETVKNFAADRIEVRSFKASDRCSDGGYATFGLMTCSVGAH